jgi:hypothetical protein
LRRIICMGKAALANGKRQLREAQLHRKAKTMRL